MNEAMRIMKTEYDSIFLSLPLQLSPSLFHRILVTSGRKREWPPLPHLQQLPQLFTIVETFLLDDDNWSASSCNDSQIDSIQQRLEEISKILQCQKHYGFLFWSQGHRFVQSSVVHLFILLRMLIFSLIPQECETLLQANSQDKLMTNMEKIEVMVNSMLPLWKQIHQFMFQEEFEEEKELTKLFFKELSEFMLGLPRLQKSQIPHIPTIMEYVNISISLLAQENQGQQQQIQQRARTLLSSKDQSILPTPTPTPNNLQCFQFKPAVRNGSFNPRKKKLTVTTNETKQNSSQEKERSSSRENSLNTSQTTRLAGHSITERPKTKFSIETSVHKRNKPNKARKNSSLKKERKVLKWQETEKERESNIKKQPRAKITIETRQFSRQIEIDTGVPRGWGAIHEHMQTKILNRKLRKLFIL